MRLLQIAAGDGALVELHPYVSVVQGLDEDLRQRLIDTVAGLPSGQQPKVGGLLEAHGVFLDLTGDTLQLLDLTDTGDLEVVVRAKDLPGSALSPAARQLRSRQQAREDLNARLEAARRESDVAARAAAAAEEAVGRARRALDDALASAGQRVGSLDEVTSKLDEMADRRRQLESELADAGPAIEAAEAARAEVEAATATVRGERRDAADRCTRIAALLEEVEGGLDHDADQAVAAAAAHVAAVEAQNAAEIEAQQLAAGGGDAIAPEPPTERVARLAARMEELRGLLTALVPFDRMAVEDALLYMQHLDELEHVPSVEAFTLADELENIESKLRTGDEGFAADGERLAAARLRLDDARQALLEAEQALRSPELARADIDALEAAHHELLQAQDKADGRFGGARAQKRVDDARDAENAILDRLGFTTYADFMMGTSILHVDPQREGALDRARTELADAEDDWNELQVGVDAELARAELHEHRRTARERAHALVGQTDADADLVAELRALRVPAVAPEEAASAIASALAVVGIDIGDDVPDPATLVSMADTWLAEEDLATARREEALDELRRLDLEHAEATAEARDADAEALVAVPTLDPEQRRRARVDEATAGLAAAEARRSRHLHSEADAARLHAELNEAAAVEQEAAALAADADQRVSEAEAALAAAVERKRALEVELDEVRLAEETVSDELRSFEGGHSSDEQASLETDMAERAEALERAQASAESLRVDVARLTGELDALDVEIQQLTLDAAAAASGDAPAADEVEWYLLARLAAQRSVSYAGSVPLLIDDALRGLEPAEVRHLLDRLERMAAAVQVIYVSDDPGVAAWAAVAGPDRAAVVSPEPAPA